MLIAHKIALKPNNVQATYFARAAGVARFAYNWALAEWKKQYEVHKLDPGLPRPSEAALRRKLNAAKREEFPWMLEVTKNAPQMAIIQLGEAFRNFFQRRAGYPKFRKKGVHDRFTLTNDQFTVAGTQIRIPNLGFVRMQENLRFTGRIMSATVSRTADRWFASSKTCSCCGHVHEAMPLSVRTWTCPACNVSHDRDVNAAINLKNMAVSSTVTVCGEEGAGQGIAPMAKPASVKQKFSRKLPIVSFR